MIKKLPHDHGNLSLHLQAEIPSGDTFGNVAEILKLMSDGKRIQIFWILCHCEECVINISALVEMSSPAVSHHLKILKTGGLVISRREGKEVYYTVAKTPRSEILHRMIENMIEVECPSDEVFEDSLLYDSAVQTVNDARDFMVCDLKRRYTIEELSKKFHINQTTFKTVFKTVFGQSVAAYMKILRIKKAMEYLVQTDKTIAEIAFEVGYESQSKFTQAFKSVTGMLPKEYRKNR